MKKSEATSHVVIVGGGFGGLAAARALGRAAVSVTLVDRRNHHLFQPLLYQVATAALSPGDIAYPIRSALRRQKNVRVLLAEVVGIDREAKRLELDNGTLDYDHLILAAGATHSYFGHREWERHAPGLKSVEDALEMRRRVLLAYEAAERETDPIRRSEWLTFVVVGAGPTGVELAGALAEIGRKTMARDFRNIDPRETRVILLEGASSVLTSFPPPLTDRAREQLEELGVEVRCESLVSDIDERGATIDGERVGARTVLWAAGVAASPLGALLGVALDRSGRVIVAPDLTVPGHPEIHVVGDMASIGTGESSVPGVAPAALQGGRHAAANIVRTITGKPTLPFRYVDKGMLATVGRSKAVGHFRGRWQLSGLFAWVLWWAVHVFFLIGFRNRIAVMFGWIWNYVTFQRGARLITGDIPRLPRAARKHDSTLPVRTVHCQSGTPSSAQLSPCTDDGEADDAKRRNLVAEGLAPALYYPSS